MKRAPFAALGIDAVVVLLFAGLGRRSHDESSGLTGTLSTAAPFLIGLAVAWGVAAMIELRRRSDLRRLLSVDAGVVIALVTVAVGMLLRRTLWDRGIAWTFIVVTAAFVTFACGLWRAAWQRFGNRHADAGTSAG